ncbi:uncharacterized protein calml4b [Misgurnus anguillicaudatus]|uniref:uncharacterized protein calml4b n=1 Tax=Misgurnus anguillicaudatus TaxID=75329 RepID=UPI003CCF18CD
MREQQLHDVRLAALRRDLQRRHAVTVHHHRRLTPNQFPHDVQMPGLCGKVQCGGPAVSFGVGIRAAFQQEVNDVGVALVGGYHQACVVVLIGDAKVCVVLDEKPGLNRRVVQQKGSQGQDSSFTRCFVHIPGQGLQPGQSRYLRHLDTLMRVCDAVDNSEDDSVMFLNTDAETQYKSGEGNFSTFLSMMHKQIQQENPRAEILEAMKTMDTKKQVSSWCQCLSG